MVQNRRWSQNLRRLLVILSPFLVLGLAAFYILVRGQSSSQIQYDLVYGEAGGQKLLLDIFKPDKQGKGTEQKVQPALIFIHGGAWQSGNKSEMRDLALEFAKLGYVCFSVDYRLASKDRNHYPAQLDDVQLAVRWVRANADKFGIDPNRIGALGLSAGGHLAALLGTRETRDTRDLTLAKYSSRVNCVVDLFGPADLFAHLEANPSTGTDEKSILINFLGKSLTEAPELYREASPLYFIDRQTVPFLIFHGAADALVSVDQSRRFYQRLRQSGIEATYIEFPDEGHGFSKKENLEKFFIETLAFLNRHLRKL